jgi:predicted DNA-binding protein
MEPSLGRPRIGTAVHIRLPDELLARIDEHAAARGITRAQAIRILIEDGLDEQPSNDFWRPPHGS